MNQNKLAKEFAEIIGLEERFKQFIQKNKLPEFKTAINTALANSDHTKIMNATINFISSLIMLTFKTENDPVYEDALSFCNNLIKNNVVISQDATCVFVVLIAT